MQTTENTSTTKATRQEEMPYSSKAQHVRDIMDAYQIGCLTTVECLSQISTLPWNPIEQVGIQKILDDSIRIDLSALEFHINQ